MMAGGLAVKTRTMVDAPALFIGRAIIKTADAGKGYRCRAHCTGFQRHIEIGACQPLILQNGAGTADRQDFRMGRHVLQGTGFIASLGKNDAVLDQHSTNWHLAARASQPGFFQGNIHETGCQRHDA